MKVFSVLAVLSLSTLIASCANSPPPDPVIVVEYSFLPERFLVPCVKPVWPGGRWLDIAGFAKIRGNAIDDCNRQLQEARDFQRKEKSRLENR